MGSVIPVQSAIPHFVKEMETTAGLVLDVAGNGFFYIEVTDRAPHHLANVETTSNLLI